MTTAKEPTAARGGTFGELARKEGLTDAGISEVSHADSLAWTRSFVDRLGAESGIDNLRDLYWWSTKNCAPVRGAQVQQAYKDPSSLFHTIGVANSEMVIVFHWDANTSERMPLSSFLKLKTAFAEQHPTDTLMVMDPDCRFGVFYAEDDCIGVFPPNHWAARFNCQDGDSTQ